MKPNLSQIAGTRDYVERDAATLRELRDNVERIFARYAYVAVDPPILERAAPFIDRSGEDIRRRMYVFSDPSGRELCLRPELTIPACRLFLREGGLHGQERRLSYVGPAFRYDFLSEGRYRQFSQAGIELIGTRNAEAADAEVLAVALDALAACGITDLDVVLGDLDLVSAFINGLPIADRWKSRLMRATKSKLALDALASPTGEPRSENSSQLLGLLASIGSEKARVVVSEVLALADVRHVGGRTPEDIAERLVARAADDGASAVSREIVEGVAALLNIRMPIGSAVPAIREVAGSFDVDIAQALERCQRRLDILIGYGHDPAEFILDAGLRRDLAYYSGFVFEVFVRGDERLGHLCGGGRYDGLLEALGAGRPVPAVGFALGLERVLVARTKSTQSPAQRLRPDALVVTAGEVSPADCARVATALRAAGWSVEMELSGRKPKNAMSHAYKREIPYIAFVGEEEMRTGQVRLKRLDDHVETLVHLGELTEHAQREANARSNKSGS